MLVHLAEVQNAEPSLVSVLSRRVLAAFSYVRDRLLRPRRANRHAHIEVSIKVLTYHANE